MLIIDGGAVALAVRVGEYEVGGCKCEKYGATKSFSKYQVVQECG